MSQFLRNPAAILLGQTGAASATHTGTTAETTLATITIPAGMMGANGCVGVEALWSFSGAGGNRTPRIRFGGQQAYSVAATSTQLSGVIRRDILNRNAANSQVTASLSASGGPYGTVADVVRVFAVDTSAAVDITLTIALANAADSAILEAYQVIVWPKP